MGPRGEGYVILQFVLALGIIFAPKISQLDVPTGIQAAGMVLLFLSLTLAVWSLFTLGRNLTPLPHPRQDNHLVRSGPYRIVRHPMYTSVLSGVFGYSLVFATPLGLLGSILLALLLDRKTHPEEAWLIQRHPEYKTYRKEVKKLIPWVY